MYVKINIRTISSEVQRIVRKYGEKEPLRLAKTMGIIVSFEPMGLYEGCCKGFFICHCRKKHITINSDLPRELQRVVLAHELGHCILHAKNGSMAAFHETTLFDTTDCQEYEANVFASELLLSDEEVLETLNEDAFFFQAASALYVPAELLDFKFRVMKRKGYKLESPITANGDFLKKIEKSCRTK